MSSNNDAEWPDEFEIFEFARLVVSNIWTATVDFINDIWTSGLGQFVALVAVFVLVQGVGADMYRLAKSVLASVCRVLFRVSRFNLLARFLSGPVAIVVTEYKISEPPAATELDPILQKQLELLRVSACISQGSYQSLAALTKYFVSRGQRDISVVGDKQVNADNDYVWRFDTAPKQIVLGSQINNLAAQSIGGEWNKIHDTKITFDNDFTDDQVGVSLRDADGTVLHTIRATRDANGCGEDGAILIYSRQRVTRSKSILQIAGCTAIGTQALVTWLTSPANSDRLEFALRTAGKDDFIAFFKLGVQNDRVTNTSLARVFGRHPPSVAPLVTAPQAMH
jgi:hypothetical protein